MVLTFKSGNEILSVYYSNDSYYFHVVLFIMLHKMILTFRFVDKSLVCDHSNESY